MCDLEQSILKVISLDTGQCNQYPQIEDHVVLVSRIFFPGNAKEVQSLHSV